MRYLIAVTNPMAGELDAVASRYFAVALRPELCREVLRRMDATAELRRRDGALLSVEYRQTAGEYFDRVPQLDGTAWRDVRGMEAEALLRGDGMTVIDIPEPVEKHVAKLFLSAPLRMDCRTLVAAPDDVQWRALPRRTARSEETCLLPRAIFQDALSAAVAGRPQ